MKYILPDCFVIDAETPNEFVAKLRANSNRPARTEKAYREQFARRVYQWQKEFVPTETNKIFLHALVSVGHVRVLANQNNGSK